MPKYDIHDETNTTTHGINDRSNLNLVEKDIFIYIDTHTHTHTHMINIYHLLIIDWFKINIFLFK
jgi:hypothetical protein